jgi:hypothetical protein
MHENAAIAFPRSTGPQRSARTPGALLRGALTNVPVKKRPTKRLPKFGAKAHKKLNAIYAIKVE